MASANGSPLEASASGAFRGSNAFSHRALHFTLSPKNGVVEEWGRARMTRGTKERSVGFSPCHYPRNPSGPWRPLRRVFGLCRASVCDSGLKGRFQSDCGCVVMHGVPGAYAPGSAETGPSGLWGAVAACAWFVPCVCLRLRPEELFSSSPGRSPRYARFCSGDGSPEHAAPRPEVGQRPRTTLPRASPDGLGSEVPNLFLKSQPMHSTITIGG